MNIKQELYDTISYIHSQMKHVIKNIKKPEKQKDNNFKDKRKHEKQ